MIMTSFRLCLFIGRISKALKFPLFFQEAFQISLKRILKPEESVSRFNTTRQTFGAGTNFVYRRDEKNPHGGFQIHLNNSGSEPCHGNGSWSAQEDDNNRTATIHMICEDNKDQRKYRIVDVNKKFGKFFFVTVQPIANVLRCELHGYIFTGWLIFFL